MISFKEFLIESAKQYKFDVKVAGELDDSQMELLEVALDKWGLASISKPKRSPIQQHPADFPLITNTEVSVMEIILNYPCTPDVLANCIAETTKDAAERVKVYNDGDPGEAERNEEVAADEDEGYEVQLTAPYPKSSGDASYGDKYNKKFLKDLEKTPKMRISGSPSPKAQSTNDLPQGKLSPIGSTKMQKPTADKM